MGGFNGAAFFQSGKSGRAFRNRACHINASMEPLFFKAENGAPRRALTVRMSTLQWSRFFSKRKMVRLVRHPSARL